MLQGETLVLFVWPAILLLIVPGPVSIYIMARGIEQGRPAAVAALLGVQCGDLLHIVAAASGISVIYTSSPVLADALHYGGAAYLLILASQALRVSRKVPGVLEEAQRQGFRSLRRIFSQSLLINVLSPQTALFYLAFLPAFVTPDRGSVFAQFLALGLIFLLLGLVIEGMYALAAGSVGRRMCANTVFARINRWLVGAVYATIAAVLVLGSAG
jgi:threonine/homoserine/homoserine lactone efflux protein